MDLRGSFTSTSDALISMAKEVSASEISDNCIYIKCYDIIEAEQNYRDIGRYKLDCALYRERVNQNQIIEDLLSFVTMGHFIDLLDLELFYTTSSENLILAKVYFSDSKTIMRWHACLPRTMSNINNKHFNINDYANEIAQRYNCML